MSAVSTTTPQIRAFKNFTEKQRGERFLKFIYIKSDYAKFDTFLQNKILNLAKDLLGYFPKDQQKKIFEDVHKVRTYTKQNNELDKTSQNKVKTPKGGSSNSVKRCKEYKPSIDKKKNPTIKFDTKTK